MSLEGRWFSKPASPGLSWALAAALAISYVAALYSYGALLFQDYPNHLARAVILADLWFRHGEHFGAAFEFQGMFYPYIAADYMLGALVGLLGQQGATLVWTAMAVLSLPLAMLCYLRSMQAPAETRAFVFLISLYFSTNSFFLLGFVNFCFAISLAVLALALAQRLRAHFSGARYAGYVLVIAFGFLMHLAFVVFAAAAVGSTALVRLRRRASTLGREVLLLLPIVLTLVWYALCSRIYALPKDVIPAHYVRTGLRDKFRQLDWPLLRFDETVDLIFALAFVLLCAAAARPQFRLGRAAEARSQEAAALVLGFSALYLVLPGSYGDPTYLDVRALPMLLIFAFLWWILPPSGAPKPGALGSRALLAANAIFLAANLGYVCSKLSVESSWLRQYRALLSSIPQGSRVLPVYTGEHKLNRWPLIHVASYIVTDRDGIEPYLFAGDQGQPMKYFRYRDHPYAPHNTWYSYTPQPTTPDAIDWPALSCTYDYLLVMKPFSASRIMLPAQLLAENSSAALLVPQHTGCPAH